MHNDFLVNLIRSISRSFLLIIHQIQLRSKVRHLLLHTARNHHTHDGHTHVDDTEEKSTDHYTAYSTAAAYAEAPPMKQEPIASISKDVPVLPFTEPTRAAHKKTGKTSK